MKQIKSYLKIRCRTEITCCAGYHSNLRNNGENLINTGDKHPIARRYRTNGKTDHRITRINHRISRDNNPIARNNHLIGRSNNPVGRKDHPVALSDKPYGRTDNAKTRNDNPTARTGIPVARTNFPTDKRILNTNIIKLLTIKIQ